MLHAIPANNASLSTSMERKSYPVNVKGLMTHLRDILFVEFNTGVRSGYAEELSPHLQKDLGVYR